jgi:DNA polymerase elongation subunit (family B)
MSIEIHVQCRTGASRLDSKKIPMAPDSNKDKICTVVFVYGIDPGGGESLDVLSRGCIFVPFETENLDRNTQNRMIRSSMPGATLGIAAPLTVESVKDEKSLLLRLASIVRMKDPDMLLSWDTQGAGLGYLIERGVILGNDGKAGVSSNVEVSSEITGVDMVRLLGRTPNDKNATQFLVNTPVEKPIETNSVQATSMSEERKWRGSGLGSDWDERVGAGAAAASIVSTFVVLTASLDVSD